MIIAQVQQQSAGIVSSYMEDSKKRVFAAVREGVAEGVEKLSWTIADKLQGNPIISRSGLLLAAVLDGTFVRETQTRIEGGVRPNPSKLDAQGIANLPLWLEEGTHIPGVINKLMAFHSGATGALAVIRGHQAFTVDAKPFMNPSLQESQGPIFDLIAQKVAYAA